MIPFPEFFRVLVSTFQESCDMIIFLRSGFVFLKDLPKQFVHLNLVRPVVGVGRSDAEVSADVICHPQEGAVVESCREMLIHIKNYFIFDLEHVPLCPPFVAAGHEAKEF